MIKYLKWVPSILLAALIYYLSSKTWPTAPTIPYIDKIIHFCVYGLLAFFICLPLGKDKWITASIISFIYGITDEYHQSFVPGRNSSVTDIITNGIGAFTISYIYMIICKYKCRGNIK